MKGNDTDTMAAISKGLTAHKVKVVSWSNRNRNSKSWRKKGGSGGGATPPSLSPAQDSDLPNAQKESADNAAPLGTLGPKEVEQASALVDQLKKLLSQ